MSKRIKMGNIEIAIIEEQEPDICEMCGKVDELRPYGPNGENICYECGMKDEIAMHKQINKKLFGIDLSDEEAKKELKTMKRLEKGVYNETNKIIH